ncbi:MAG: hypothetical protein IKU25_08350 [Clostridia bacterium]|nr:hypothetical protein [Clostridia bacterium]
MKKFFAFFLAAVLIVSVFIFITLRSKELLGANSNNVLIDGADDEDYTTGSDQTTTQPHLHMTTGEQVTTTTQLTTTKPTTTTTTKPATTTTEYEIMIPGYTGGVDGKVDPSNPTVWGEVVDDVYTSENGGIQLYMPGWKKYGLYGITLITNDYLSGKPVSAVTIDAFPTGTPAYNHIEDFDNVEKKDMERVFQMTIEKFEKTTIGGEYPCYVAVVPDSYYVWYFKTPGARYFIVFMPGPNCVDLEEESNRIMDSIVIYK